jgi:flagellar biosynthesis GTPase FlhF
MVEDLRKKIKELEKEKEDFLRKEEERKTSLEEIMKKHDEEKEQIKRMFIERLGNYRLRKEAVRLFKELMKEVPEYSGGVDEDFFLWWKNVILH